MAVAKVIEITADSKKGFEDAIKHGIKKASKSLEGIQAAWVANQEVFVENDEVVTYRVHLKVTFLLHD